MPCRIGVEVRRILLVIAAASTFLPGSASGSTGGARACAADYAYAGLVAPHAAAGISARISPLVGARVRWGHVAAWVGVGGPGRGPHGSDEWIQAGVSGFEQGASSVYYEVARPGVAPEYTEVTAQVEPGDSHSVAVLEIAGSPGWWRVSVDGATVGANVYLPGSHGRWEPMAMTESWNGGHGVCNDFRYSFAGVRIAESPGGAWAGLRHASVLERGERVVALHAASFTAVSG